MPSSSSAFAITSSRSSRTIVPLRSGTCCLNAYCILISPVLVSTRQHINELTLHWWPMLPPISTKDTPFSSPPSFPAVTFLNEDVISSMTSGRSSHVRMPVRWDPMKTLKSFAFCGRVFSQSKNVFSSAPTLFACANAVSSSVSGGLYSCRRRNAGRVIMAAKQLSTLSYL